MLLVWGLYHLVLIYSDDYFVLIVHLYQNLHFLLCLYEYILFLKLDGVGPINNRPSPAKLHHFVPQKKKKKVTCDTWHVTRDTWHMTCDTFGEVNIPSKFQLPSSYCLWFMIIWRSGGKGWLSKWVSNEAVYRTAPATPGLLIIM